MAAKDVKPVDGKADAREDARQSAISDILLKVQQVARSTHEFTRSSLKEFGAAGPEILALMALAKASRMTVGQLAGQVNLHISTVSSLADQLVKKGWVTRERSEDDRRVVWLRVSKEGRSVLSRSEAPPRAKLPDGLEKMKTADLIATQRALQRISDIIGLEKAPEDRS